MTIDEYIHHQRGLGMWERLGHPVDTLTVFVALSYVALNPYTSETLTVYLMLSGFSCLVITKDEFVHTKECGAFENWLHALLFILHPVIFLSAGLLWRDEPENQFLDYWAIMVGVFMLYQILRWSIPWKEIRK